MLVEFKKRNSICTKMESQQQQQQKQSMLTEIIKNLINFANENLYMLDISQIHQAERSIIKLAQSKYFSEEMKKLLIKKQGFEEAELKKSNQIYNLDEKALI